MQIFSSLRVNYKFSEVFQYYTKGCSQYTIFGISFRGPLIYFYIMIPYYYIIMFTIIINTFIPPIIYLINIFQFLHEQLTQWRTSSQCIRFQNFLFIIKRKKVSPWNVLLSPSDITEPTPIFRKWSCSIWMSLWHLSFTSLFF